MSLTITANQKLKIELQTARGDLTERESDLLSATCRLIKTLLYKEHEKAKENLKKQVEIIFFRKSLHT